MPTRRAPVREDAEARERVRDLLVLTIEGAAGDGKADNIAEDAAALEDACFAATPDREAYRARYRDLCAALPRPYGEWLDRPLARYVLDGDIAPADAADPAVFDAHRAPDPRRVARALLWARLRADPRARFPPARAADFARRLERGCYNDVIRTCIESQDSYRRGWDSPVFVAIYSGACGRIAVNLDPRGTIAAHVARLADGEGAAVNDAPPSTFLLDALDSGDVSPDVAGHLDSASLCPSASRRHRAYIALRLGQRVEQKASSLFACPGCHVRCHTYRQVQIGAGDEASTFMCTCLKCGLEFEGRA